MLESAIGSFSENFGLRFKLAGLLEFGVPRSE